ncbi:glycogen accumulation regulator GarA [Corynebacterium sphenisci]|uniref:glycogen accumulation regulator GarA n=1 Tax=Corynebacterium sphenisci TaxID=191493 RepID=UPI0026DF52DF|nr:oxoglutarate dehydrogenase inhibitor Odhl [Corynebacterium sphenisci]MDO5730079.1 oxoglutarate dehydrogenase inhibitor Odhl [Corynebacterium sphenisci]
MSDNTGAPEPSVETTSVFRADLLKEMETGPGKESAVSGVEGLPEGSALLVVKRGPNAGSRFLLDQAVTTAGRHPDSDIFLDDVTVSRRHAEFRLQDGSFEVVDVGSLNGTYVNREPKNSAALGNGDEVQIGKFRLVFLTASAED